MDAIRRLFIAETPPARTPVTATAETVTLAPAGPEDAVTLADIDKRCFPHPWSAGDFASALQSSACAATMAMAGAQPLGAVLLEYQRTAVNRVNINSLAVVPEAQGRKIGERLLVSALGEARAKGVAVATLEVDVTNEKAQRLYRKVGFEITETLPNYYWDEGHDAYRMQLDGLQDPAVGERLDALDAKFPHRT